MPDVDMESSNNKPNPSEEQYDPSILPDMLPVYYKRLFPHKPFYRWLSYGLTEDGVFANREISFTLHDDIYIRYLCFETQMELEKEICNKCPFKIDIGPVMSSRPKNFRISAAALVPVQRELVFDIDLTDYDNVRNCCSGAGVCQKCWKFMVIAAKVIDIAMREDFGYEHILWVFSGRRGVHCWVCDNEARHLNGKHRNALAEYMQIINNVNFGNEVAATVQLNDRIHHSIRRALKIIEPYFEEIILEDQNLFGTPSGVRKLTQLINDENACKEAEAYLKKNCSEGAHSKVVWEAFVKYAHSMRTGGANIWNRKLKHIVEEVQLSMLYPRLDINVTKGFNHLLKAPFCIHPATGKVCVPFTASAAAKFDPTSVPTISKLLQEINAFDDKNKTDEVIEDKSRIKDYKKTSMFKGVLVFEEFIRKLENSFKTSSVDQKMDF